MNCKKHNSKSILFMTLFFIVLLQNIFCVKFNSWELLIYRPENSQPMNNIRCYLKLQDENGNDVTFSKCKATYYYANNVVKDKKSETMQFSSIFHRNAPRQVFNYKKKYFFEGGLVMYLLLKPGKYKISVFTPKDEHFLCKTENKDEWKSNVFEYDTQNPAKVLFVSPVANENGFYTGSWHIDYKAPSFYKFTKPKIETK